MINRHKTLRRKAPGRRARLVMLLVVMMLVPKPGFASCETGPAASTALTGWVQQSITLIQDFEQKIIDFFTDDIETGEVEMQTRIQEFDQNVQEGLMEWWEVEMRPTMQDMTKQLSTAIVNETQLILSQMDAAEQNRQLQHLTEVEMAAKKRHATSDFACQADSVNPGYGRREKMAREIARGTANDGAKRAVAAAGTPEAAGPVLVFADKWDNYIEYYCDSTAFDNTAGCDVDGPMPNADITLGSGFLWGERMSFNLDTPYNKQLYIDLHRNFIDHSTPSAIPTDRMQSPEARRQFNQIRSNAARKQSVYAVVGQIMADRVSGPAMEPLPEVRDIRVAAGVPLEDTTETPSKYEILHALTEERYMNPEFVVQITNNPNALLRDNLDSKSMHLQQVTQWQKRMEELAVMMAAGFAEDIEHRD